ncbi:ATP-dependent helicase [uncultured Microbacterium sp.]|uniref:ATP-dependent helicase n=1 Tax=uncultured Microbacterium sp. TaxID=191216 RepID=UPI0025D88F07|nr:ATP-dependent helicase [uncultured Microbacterium sp.]
MSVPERDLGVDRALRGLDDEQRAAASALRGPVRVLAGAGTGKTRVITHRIAHGVDTGMFSPQRVMAVTFTARAAGEMRGRLRALGIEGVQARTFHAAALSQLNHFWPIVTGGENAPEISPNKVRLLADAARALRLDLGTPALRDIASEIEWRKVSMIDLETYARRDRPRAGGLSVSAIVDLQAGYERLKDERRQLDFEDVLLACAGMIEAEPRVAQQVREQYRHFTVDEYQDVSPLQHHLLRLWLGARDDLCVVGDASQTIYSFAGADARFLLDFERTYPNATLVRLEHNYRSSPIVLGAANRLMRGRPGALTLVSGRRATTAERADASTPAAPFGGPQTDLPEPPDRPAHLAEPAAEPPVRGFVDDADEAHAVAAAIARRIADGVRPESIAVLYRAHSQSLALQSALTEAGVSARVLGGARFFDQPEVREALLMLRGESITGSTGSLVDAVRNILRGLGLTDEPPAAGGALRDAWEARAALLRLAEETAARHPRATLRSFTDDLQARAKDQHEPAVASVTLSTLHAAKGLEWDVVHIVGLSEGLLPISYALLPNGMAGFEAIDEERRLLYVGITRARRELALSWAESAQADPRAPRRTPRERSRFVAELGIRTPRAAGRPAPASRARS